MKKRSNSEQEIEEVRQMCEGYLGAMDRLNESNLRISELSKKMKSNVPDYAKWLYRKEINNIKSQMQKDIENTGYLRWALGHLESKDRSVMEQLYVEGYAWDSILNEEGKSMSAGSIDLIRKRSFREMAKLISWMRNRVQREHYDQETKTLPDETGSAEDGIENWRHGSRGPP